MDKDPEAVRSATKQFGGDPRFEIEQGSFVMLGNLLAQRHLQGQGERSVAGPRCFLAAAG